MPKQRRRAEAPTIRDYVGRNVGFELTASKHGVALLLAVDFYKFEGRRLLGAKIEYNGETLFVRAHRVYALS